MFLLQGCLPFHAVSQVSTLSSGSIKKIKLFPAADIIMFFFLPESTEARLNKLTESNPNQFSEGCFTI